jgi:hypothetical protein
MRHPSRFMADGVRNEHSDLGGTLVCSL